MPRPTEITTAAEASPSVAEGAAAGTTDGEKSIK